jgi:hypothetical protein
MAKQKRDNDYYKQRLKKERPDLYRDVQDGKLTVNKARRMHGGLGGVRTPLTKLKSAWDTATAAEKRDFLIWVRSKTAPVAAKSGSTSPSGAAVFGATQTLESWARRRVLEVIARRGLSAGDFAEELGLSRLDQAVITGAKNGTKIRSSDARSSLERWLKKNVAV